MRVFDVEKFEQKLLKQAETLDDYQDACVIQYEDSGIHHFLTIVSFTAYSGSRTTKRGKVLEGSELDEAVFMVRETSGNYAFTDLFNKDEMRIIFCTAGRNERDADQWGGGSDFGGYPPVGLDCNELCFVVRVRVDDYEYDSLIKSKLYLQI